MKSERGAGLLAGAVAGLVMTFVMLLLAWLGQVATPLVILGDRFSVFLPPGPFLAIMGRVGGYTHLKELGVSSVIFGQIVVGALGGWFYGWRKRSLLFSLGIYFFLPLVVSIVVLWPQLGTSYNGFPIRTATVITCLGLALSFLAFERTLVLGFGFLTRAPAPSDELEYSPSIGRRALLFGGLGLLVAGGGAAVIRRLYQAASFSYDGTQYKGAEVQGITPNDHVLRHAIKLVDLPNEWAWMSLAQMPNRRIPMKGVGFAGDRGVSKVEVTTDDGKSWEEATIEYPGTRLTWVLWSYDWRPPEPGEYHLSVRATDGAGAVQQVEKERGRFSGTTGFHQVTVYLLA